MNRSLFAFALAALITGATAHVGMAGAVCLVEDDIIETSYTPGAGQPGEAELEEYLDGATDPSYMGVDVGESLYKWNREDPEEGPLAGSYEVVDLINGGEGGGTIRYTPPGAYVDTSQPAFLVVKGGGNFVMYDLNSTGSFGVNWDGVMDLKFTGAGVDNKISNVSLWGQAVPEPTTLAIWTLVGVCGVGAARRNRRKKA